MPIGVLTNCAAVLLGGLLGTYLGKILSQGLKDNLPTLFGFCSIAIGINSIIKASGMTAVVLAILVGFTIGHSLHLEHWTSKFFHGLVRTLHLGGGDIDMEFYITAVALFCCSGFGWYSTLTEGITGDPSLLMSKAVLDFFTTMIFAASLGKSHLRDPSAAVRDPSGRVHGRPHLIRIPDPHNVCGSVGLRRDPDPCRRFPGLQDQVPSPR